MPIDATSGAGPCSPRVLLLPSFPTSGNELVHALFEGVTNVATLSVYKRKGPRAYSARASATADELSFYRDNDVTLCRTGRVLPVGRSSALVKTHWPSEGAEVGKREKRAHAYDGERWFAPAGLAGVVRVARNPGDHVLRNNFRWGHKQCKGKCFFDNAKVSCPKLAKAAAKWNFFHSFWNAYNGSVPTMLLRYEEVAFSPESAVAQITRLLDIANTTEKAPGTLAKEVKGTVRVPDYEPGTLVKRVRP